MWTTFWSRPLGAKLILVFSLAFLLLTLAPWQRPCAVTTDDRICGFVTAWHGFGIWAGVLSAVTFVWELLPIVWPRLSMRGWPTATISAILGVALVVATIAKMIDDNEFQTGWAWVGFGLALAIALTALVRVRFRWSLRARQPDEAPPSGDH